MRGWAPAMARRPLPASGSWLAVFAACQGASRAMPSAPSEWGVSERLATCPWPAARSLAGFKRQARGWQG